MTFDRRGSPITAQSDAEIASIDWFTARLARIDRGAEAILEDAKSFPGSPMIQLGAASFCLFGQTAAADQAAAGYLAAAQPLLASATERERQLHRALTLWGRKDHLGSVAVLEDITRAWPRDLLAAKIAEFLYYVLGQQHEGERFRAHMARLADANADDPDFLATYAFAQELCGDVRPRGAPPSVRSRSSRATRGRIIAWRISICGGTNGTKACARSKASCRSG